jgi:hypothetical protein
MTSNQTALLLGALLMVTACVTRQEWPDPEVSRGGAPSHSTAAGSYLPPSVWSSAEDFNGPYAGWRDVKAEFGAVGDGTADDSGAIQKGLDALRKFDAHGGAAVLYFPPGTYRITRTLTMRLNAGANLVGADPAVTIVAWDGPKGGTMLRTSGSFDTLFERITWDGRQRADIAIAQWWNFASDRGKYQGSIKHIDETFRDVGIGIFGGRLGKDYGEGDSETLIRRVKFIRNTVAGVNLGSFNALNFWVWDSEFRDCARGVSNEFSFDDKGPAAGAGNFSVYRSLFLRSTVADISIGNTQWFSFRDNVSIGSARFLSALQTGANAATMLVQDNRVIDTTEPVSIRVGNEGPLLLIDNQFRSLPGATGPVVQLYGTGIAADRGDRDVLSVGNRYTVANPVQIARSGGRLLADGDSTVDPDAIDASPPVLPGIAQRRRNRIIEIKPGASTGEIQEAIDTAAAGGGADAVVHLAAGDYHVTRELRVPANANIEIAGDSELTTLWWSGTDASGTVFRLIGPSLATIRDVGIIGGHATAIAIAGADQVGGRISVDASYLASVRISGMHGTRVEFQANTSLAGLQVDDSRSVMSLGCGGLGPIRISANSSVMVSESWYEGKRADVFRGDSGEFTYLAGLVAPYVHGVEAGLSPDEPAILLDGFKGDASVIGMGMALISGRNGIDVASLDESASALFLAVGAAYGGAGADRSFFRSGSTRGNTAMVLAKIYVPPAGARDIPDAGRNDLAFIARGLRQARSVQWEIADPVKAPGATHVQLFRVMAPDTAVGLKVEP